MSQLRVWLRTPMGWLVFMVTEYLAVIAVLRAVLPDRMPVGVGVAVLVAVVAALFFINLRIRRWISAPDRDR